MKNRILKTITSIDVILLIFFMSAFDSESIIPVIGTIVTMIWVILFEVANYERLK